jgi:hypothetical protein
MARLKPPMITGASHEGVDGWIEERKKDQAKKGMAHTNILSQLSCSRLSYFA